MNVCRVQLRGWPRNVAVFYTTREQGISAPPYEGFNLGDHVGDTPESVAANRQQLLSQLPPATRVAWLKQVHGTEIVPASTAGEVSMGDGSWTRERSLACAVMSADCLPVLFTDRAGSVVAAAHAGWRGLAAGVLEATIDALPVPANTLLAWLGPAIGPAAFEVGPEVRDAFAAGQTDPASACFRPSPYHSRHYLADLACLARLRLAARGVVDVQASGACTYSDSPRFFSHRRDGVTGRMASLILRLVPDALEIPD